MQVTSSRTTQTAEKLEYKLGRVTISFSDDGVRSTNRENPADAGQAAFDLIIPENTSITFCQDDRRGEAKHGEYLLLKHDRFYELSSPDRLTHWRITVPAADLRSRLSSADDHLGMRFKQDGRMAGLLHGLVDMIACTFRNGSPPNAEAFATEIINFVTLVLGSEQRQDEAIGRHTRFRLKQRIFDYVEGNLNDVNLAPRKIAKANRISLSYLYKLFRDNNTTVGQYIQAKRLQRAYELLVADPRGAVTVSEVAYRVGFKNASHFSRAFSQHFWIAPRDARQSGLVRQAPRNFRAEHQAAQPVFEAA